MAVAEPPAVLLPVPERVPLPLGVAVEERLALVLLPVVPLEPLEPAADPLPEVPRAEVPLAGLAVLGVPLAERFADPPALVPERLPEVLPVGEALVLLREPLAVPLRVGVLRLLAELAEPVLRVPPVEPVNERSVAPKAAWSAWRCPAVRCCRSCEAMRAFSTAGFKVLARIRSAWAWAAIRLRGM